MGDSFVISGLRDKRARLAGKINAAVSALNKDREALATLDAVIRMFEPDTNPDMIPAIRPTGPSLYFRRGELTRLVATALREAGKPVRCRYVAEYAIRVKGFETLDARVRERINEKIRTTLSILAHKGIVRKIVDWPETWWELAG